MATGYRLTLATRSVVTNHCNLFQRMENVRRAPERHHHASGPAETGAAGCYVASFVNSLFVPICAPFDADDDATCTFVFQTTGDCDLPPFFCAVFLRVEELGSDGPLDWAPC